MQGMMGEHCVHLNCEVEPSVTHHYNSECDSRQESEEPAETERPKAAVEMVTCLLQSVSQNWILPAYLATSGSVHEAESSVVRLRS